jgi:hypothetical protein
MTLIIQKPTGAKLVLAKDFSFDPDAAAYIAAVEAADTQALETNTRYAINNFVIGCKQDGIWNAIKASCILAGARTLTGALVPLVGTAPTNVGPFVSGDYNRKTGLVGNGSSKYLNSNRNNNADPQNNSHNALYLTTLPTVGAGLMGAGTGGEGGDTNILVAATRSKSTTANNFSSSLVSGFAGHSRSTSANYVNRANSVSLSITQASSTAFSANVFVFARSSNAAIAYANPRLAFYSIGESLDLALLDSRVTDLINAIGAAIP